MGTKPPPEPTAAMLNLSALAYLFGVTIVTWCITRSTEKHALWTRKTWTTLPWARVCFLLVLLDSWVFMVMSGVLLFGAPRQHHPHMCSTTIVMCLVCYASIKALIYLCLIERVRAVWSTKQRRWRSPVYLFCLSLLLPLVAVVAGVIIPQAIHFIYNGYCVVGINHLSSISLLTYDIGINLFLTVMFVAPLARATVRSAWLRTVAIRSTIASLIALLTTVTNGVVIYILDGHEAIWVCLGACAADVAVNVLVMYWALQGPGESDSRARTVYFSPIGQIPTFQPGPLESIVTSQDLSTISHDLSHQDTASDATAAPHVYIPGLEKPKPTIQSPRHHAFAVQRSSSKRLSLPAATERYLVFREKPESHSQGVVHSDSF